MQRAERPLRLLFLTIPIVFMVLLLVLPALQGLELSFYSNDHFSMANYAALAGDRMFWRAVANNLIVPAGSLVVELLLGLALALFLTSRPRPGAVVEVAAIFPFAIPEIVLLALTRFILVPRGYLNGVLVAAGAAPLGWIRPGSRLALLTVIVVDAWHVTPVVMLILMAGLSTIPREVYDAAQLDGAGSFATFRHITLPLLAPAILGALMLRGVDALRIFATPLVLTGAEGVPVLSTYAYQMWSDAQQPPIAMAASIVLALLITLLAAAGLMLARHQSGASIR
jgi:ABC-type sugar transport system permease subunit